MYNYNLIISTNGDVIPLIHVESLRFGYKDTDELQTIDKLNNDVTIDVRCISGKEHRVSMIEIGYEFSSELRGRELAAAIYQRWIWLLHKNLGLL